MGRSKTVAGEPLSEEPPPGGAAGEPLEDERSRATLSTWINAEDVSGIFGRGYRWLQTQVTKKRVRTEELRGVHRYHRDDVEAVVAEETGEVSEAAALRAATNLVTQAQASAERSVGMVLDNNMRMFEAHLKLSTAQEQTIEKLRAYTSSLEESNLKMRAAAEEALSLELIRKIEEKKAASAIATKEKAAQHLMELGMPLMFKQVGDWLSKKNGTPAPSSSEAPSSSGTNGAAPANGNGSGHAATPATPATPSSSFNMGSFMGWMGGLPPDSMAQFFALLKTVPPEKFGDLKTLIPPEVFEAISAIHQKVAQ